MVISTIKEIFKSKFYQDAEVLIKAPGRINIIGEHTDYNFGFVLPAAINYYMHIGLAKNNTDSVNVYSIDFDESYAVDLNDIKPADISWLSLVYGVVHQLSDKIQGFDIVFSGNVPVGAGLSSSAALCCGTAYGLSQLFELKLEKWDIAKIAQKSEHDFVNVQCGIMDQFASMFGQSEYVLLLDCQNLEYEPIPIDINGYQFVLLDSNVKHQLNESEYNSRSTETADALKKLQSIDKSIKNYRDLDTSRLENLKSEEVWWKRAFHIVSENERVLDMAEALKSHQIAWVGELLNQGHQSQKHNFEITCPETDFLAEELNKEKIVLGARQVGGGFGGCILAIVKDQGVDEMLSRVIKSYQNKFNNTARHIPIEISVGCHQVIE